MAERFSLEFETDNAAFEGPDIAVEVARILRELADDVDGGRTGFVEIHDINGNFVGTAFVPEQDEDDDE